MKNLEAIAFLKTFNEVVHQFHPGVLTIAEESTSWPAVSRPTYLKRPRLQHEVEHGLDA
jgi:1,4-alpha-glucan branching enzyme